jgi:Cu(I)/Ag(I) efflux system membrane protein CusA/SilA
MMKRIAAPMVGGMISSTLLTLIVIPAVYSLWRERQLRRTSALPVPSIPPEARPEREPALATFLIHPPAGVAG